MIHFLSSVLKKVIIIILLFISNLNSIYAFSAYSNKELDELEKEFLQQINRSELIIRDPLANQYINHLAQRLALHGEISQISFFLVNSNEITYNFNNQFEQKKDPSCFVGTNNTKSALT